MDNNKQEASNFNNSLSEAVVCYAGRISTNDGLWNGDNPLSPVLPIFAQQMILIITFIRLMFLALKPFKQPRLIPGILGGLLISPTLLGEWHYFKAFLFPTGSVMALETLANLGVLYFSFLLALQIDIKTMLRPGKEALNIAIAGTIIPFAIGMGIYFLLVKENRNIGGAFFCGAALTVTGFMVLTEVLTALKLFHGDIGRMAMGAAIVNDVFSWVLLAIGIAISTKVHASAGVLLSTAVLALVCYSVVGPSLSWLMSQTPEDQNLSKFHICLVLTGVVLAAFMADMCGSHSIIGAFLFGVSVPNGMLRSVLLEKLEDVVSGLLMPLFFGVSGLKTNLSGIITNISTVGNLVLGVVLACLAKVASTIVVSFFHNMPLLDGMAIGVLMNTKGVMALIILNVAREKLVIDDLVFASMLIAIVLMTIVITPILSVAYKPARCFLQYVQRTLEELKPAAELRVLACIYTVQNVPGIINFLQISNASRQSPMSVFALHLIELTGRASSMLIVHSTRKSNGHSHVEAESDQIADAFEKFEQDNNAVSVQPLTAMSSFATMHEDICSYAEDKHVALLILPFHRQQKINGTMGEENPSIRGINRNVLGGAPCSVGIFLDRGLGASSKNITRIAMLFFGGPDDREALSYAWRLMGNPDISLTVLRFVPSEDAAEVELLDIPILSYNDGQKQLDDQFVNEFRLQAVSNDMVTYSERASNNGEETVAMIKSMDHDYDMYIVGKGDKVISPLTAGLNDWSECPELGPIGDLLVSSDCALKVSVLVVQQYSGAEPVRGGFGMPEGLCEHKKPLDNFGHIKRPPMGSDSGLETYHSVQIMWP